MMSDLGIYVVLSNLFLILLFLESTPSTSLLCFLKTILKYILIAKMAPLLLTTETGSLLIKPYLFAESLLHFNFLLRPLSLAAQLHFNFFKSYPPTQRQVSASSHPVSS